MRHIITIANQKGGVGKTTSTMNLGVALAKAGKRVLLIDSDPQANLTSYLGVTPGQGVYESLRTLDDIYLAKRPLQESQALENFVAKTPAGVHLVASDKALSGVEYYLFNKPERERILSKFLDLIRSHYDFIMIDTPPSLNLLTTNALCASTSVLIPVQPEFFSLEGIVKIREAIGDIQTRWNPDLKLLGILPTQVSQRRKLTQEVIQALREEFGERLFSAEIHDNAAVAESSGYAQSILDYDRSSRGAQDYLAAAQEVMTRCRVTA